MVLVCFALAGAEKEPPALEALGKIALPAVHGRLDHLAADFYQGRLLIAAFGDNSLRVVSLRDNSLAGEISGLADPRGVAYVKASNRIFVANGGDGTVRSYDGSTMKPLNSLRAGPDTGDIHVDPVGGLVYAGYGNGLAVLDAKGKRLADIPLKAHPEGFQLAEKQPKLFVNLPDAHAVAVVDTARRQVTAEWPVKAGVENVPLAIDETNQRVFVVCRRPPRLLVLDMNSGRAIGVLPTVGDANDVFYDPIHARLYVTGGAGQLAIYAQNGPDRYFEMERIATAAGARTGLFVPEWNRLFVALPELGARAAEIRVYQPR